MTTAIGSDSTRPDARALTFSVTNRQDIERAVERLIAVLDAMDGDGGDSEPSLGAPEPHPRDGVNMDQTFWCQGSGSDREHDPAEDGIADGDALNLVMQEFARFEARRSRS